MYLSIVFATTEREAERGGTDGIGVSRENPPRSAVSSAHAAARPSARRFPRGEKGQKDGKLFGKSCSFPHRSASPRYFSLRSERSFVRRRTCPDCPLPPPPLPSRFRPGQPRPVLSFSTDIRVPSFSRVYVGKALDISGRRPRETQFLGACSALAWSTLAGRRYLGSFTPNVETESWHNFRRRRWRAQLTPFHASATIPPVLSRVPRPTAAAPSPSLSTGFSFSLSSERRVASRVFSRPDAPL